MYSTIHGPGYSGGKGISAKFPLPPGESVHDAFHLYAVEWAPDDIKFFFDDHLIVHRTPADLPPNTRWVYDHPFYILLNLAVGGRWPGSPDDTTIFPQRCSSTTSASTNLARPKRHRRRRLTPPPRILPSPQSRVPHISILRCGPRPRGRPLVNVCNPHSTSVEANPMITIDPPSSLATTLSTSSLVRFLNRARAAVGVRGAVDVLLSDDSTLRDLNKNFRGKDKPTDVLSFPAPSEIRQQARRRPRHLARHRRPSGLHLRPHLERRSKDPPPPRPPPPLRRRPRNRQRRNGRPRSHPPHRTPSPRHPHRTHHKITIQITTNHHKKTTSNQPKNATKSP